MLDIIDLSRIPEKDRRYHQEGNFGADKAEEQFHVIECPTGYRLAYIQEVVHMGPLYKSLIDADKDYERLSKNWKSREKQPQRKHMPTSVEEVIEEMISAAREAREKVPLETVAAVQELYKVIEDGTQDLYDLAMDNLAKDDNKLKAFIDGAQEAYNTFMDDAEKLGEEITRREEKAKEMLREYEEAGKRKREKKHPKSGESEKHQVYKIKVE